MRTVALRTADGRWIAHEVRMACSLGSRFVGLLRNRSLRSREGLLLSPAGSIHTIGMRFSIDVVFLSRQMRVLGLAPCVQPWRIRVAPSGTGRVLELAAGQIAATELALGMYIVVADDPHGKSSAAPCTTRQDNAPRSASCERLPIQFSLRLPLQRRCAALPISKSCHEAARACEQ